MVHLINKDALVAEIERRKQVAFGWMETAPNDAIEAQFELCDDILSFIKSLEVKEVDLEKEIKEEYLRCRCYGGRDNMLVIFNEPQFNNIAKHFFELGLNASNPLTWVDMMLIHKCCKDAMNSNLNAWQTAEGQQKIYEDVLKRFKTQKGK